MSGIILKKTAAGDIPTPATDKATLFLDDSTGEPTLKDDTGATASLAGPQGDPGEGVPTGGTAGQFLRKSSGTDFDTAFAAIAQSEVTNLTTDLAAKADLAGDTFTGDISVPDEAYGAGWNGSAEVPTKNALYDKIETISAGSGSVVRVAETVVGAGGVASVDFASIVNTYRHLRVVVTGRGEKAATFASLRMRLNSDSGTNYAVQISNMNNTTYAGGAAVAQTYFEIGYVTAASAPAGASAMTTVDIGDYRGTTFQKPVHAASQLRVGTAAGDQWLQDMRGVWLSTSAVTDISVFCDSGDIAEGSVVTLYGIS